MSDLGPTTASEPFGTDELVSQHVKEAGTSEGLAAEINTELGRRGIPELEQVRDSDSPGTKMAIPPPQPTSASTPTVALAPSPNFTRSDLKLQPTQPQPLPLSPSRPPYQPTNPHPSPSRLRSSSPRMHSPASSEIFERNVQESAPMAQMQGELDEAHIPSHMITEDAIPPALEASAQAITSEELGLDEVEIVMSTSHHPVAVASGLDGGGSHVDLAQMGSTTSLRRARSEDSEQAAPVSSSMGASGLLPQQSHGEGEGASTYGELDPNDVRRLSFISFADVLQSEHDMPAPGISDASHKVGLQLSSTGQERSVSPLRQPPLQQSPSLVGEGVTTPGTTHGELTIETMRQAVRKTASGDLSIGTSGVGSPVED